MQVRPTPTNESLRLDTLRGLHILDTPPEERFDRDDAATREVTQRLTQRLDEHNDEAQRGYRICYSVGQIPYGAARHATVAELLSAVDAAIYSHKQASKARTARGA